MGTVNVRSPTQSQLMIIQKKLKATSTQLKATRTQLKATRTPISPVHCVVQPNELLQSTEHSQGRLLALALATNNFYAGSVTSIQN